jgi:DNA-binding IclR family transcriptional regulator
MHAKDSPALVKSDQTLFSILALVRTRGTVTLAELAADLDVAKSTIYNHLVTLEREDFVTHTDEGYRLGLRFLDYGLAARLELDLFEVAREKVDDLAETTGEQIWCVVEEHGEAVYIYGSSGRQSIKTREYAGQRKPLHCLAAGKAILAHLPEARVDEIVDRHGLERGTENTITDRETLAAELATIRESGVAFNRQESAKGVHAIASPILGRDDEVLGAISIGGPAHRMTGENQSEDLTNLILGATNEVEINIREL